MRTTTLLLLASLTGCAGGASEPAPTPSASTKAEAAKPAAAPQPAPAAGTADAAGGADLAAGKKVYDTYCAACHQADGTSMNGMLGADFVNDATRLAKSDEELLKSIDDGVTGSKGVMPPWKGTVSPEGQKNVLAYIRETFGKK